VITIGNIDRKILVQLPEKLIEDLTDTAYEKRIPRNAFILELLYSGIKKERTKNGKKKV